MAGKNGIDVSRYTNKEELTFDVEFITPAFLGGADGNAEIRSAPFKYGIRYWWRILYGAKYMESGILKETEDAIFGSTEKKSSVDISVKTYGNIITEKSGFPNGRRIDVEHKGRSLKVNILDYLAYGKYKYVKGSGNVYNTTYIKPNTKFSVTISIKNSSHIYEIKDAVKMFFMWGCIGSKARNGFGSMLANVSNFAFSQKVVVSKELKEFPTISEYSKCFKTTKEYPTWENALSEIGCIYRDARTELEGRHVYSERGFIARPIEVKYERIPDNIRSGRIPKPFYMGLKKELDKYVGYILLLPVLFYEKENQKDYLSVINKMSSELSSKMKDDTENFLKVSREPQND